MANETTYTEKDDIQSIGGNNEDGNKQGVEVNTEGQMHIVAQGKIDSNNSTSTPLGIGGVFTGNSIDTLDYAVINVAIFSDVASADDGFSMQFSTNNVNWDHREPFTYPGAVGKTWSFQPIARYMRVVYTNGGVAQATFRLQTTLKKTYIKPSSHRIQDAIVDQDDAELVKAVITGENPTGIFINFKSTTSGNFKVSIEELENDVSVNSNTQLRTTLFNSLGYEFTIDPSTGSFVNVSDEHKQIHEGDHFNYCDYALNQAVDTEIEFVLTTPNTTKWSHLTFSVYASLGATIELYEGTNTVVGGSSITPRNNNRNSNTVSTVTILKDPTSLVDGTRAAGYLAGGNRTAGFAVRDRENVLKQNESYLVRITSLANSNNISWCAEWYEHTDVN